jgi:hypothetical protein
MPQARRKTAGGINTTDQFLWSQSLTLLRPDLVPERRVAMLLMDPKAISYELR